MFINSIAFILCICCLCIIPSIHNYTHEKTYYLLSITSTVLVLCISILCLSISTSIKYSIVLICLFIYRRNISFLLQGFLIINRSNRLTIKKDVGKLFKEHFYIRDNFHKLPNQPSIILANYGSDRFESVSAVLIPRETVFVMKKTLNNIFSFNRVVTCIETTKKDAFSYVEYNIIKAVKENKFVFCYPCESPYIKRFNYGKMHSGIFHIAMKHKIPLTLIHFDFIDTRFGSIYKQDFRIYVGDTFTVNNISQSQYRVKQFFYEQTKICIDNKTK